WRTLARPAFPADDCAPLTRTVWQRGPSPEILTELPDWRTLPRPLVLLDGLLGIGADGPIRQPLLGLAAEMDWLRRHAGARVAAVDLPSGVDPDTGRIHPHAVTADVTFMIGAPKRGLLAAHAANAVGALAVVPVEPLTPAEGGDPAMICPGSLVPTQFPRPFDFHKGMAGRVAIFAGSSAYPGAAVLAASGALRAGAGLVFLHTPPAAFAAVAAKCPPEIIVKPCRNPLEMLETAPAALALGPGLGDLAGIAETALIELLATCPLATVLDADALNFLVRSGQLDLLRENHLLTPHPGEFQRLAPDLAGLPREEAARRFVARHPATLLLKGCRTLVTASGGPLWCNPTGTPGLATGGQGDVLTGVIAARLACGDSTTTAAAFSAWLCGRPAELALALSDESEESLTPTASLARLGHAFRDWREAKR
ncbi:MAG: NAD(P)H-hydrate dehydratase, partial [Akkermansiaceae bacterium]|nr:NAD(P)H-hydrate dehydratase [Akkermansiaceae bacterium]